MTNTPTKPKHGGLYESPLLAFPGWLSLPDPDRFTENDWDRWQKAIRSANDLLKEESSATAGRVFDLAAALFVAECGEWQISDIEIAVLAVPALAYNAPLKIRKWVANCVQEYIGGIVNPKK